jgi:hypothetical protein
MARVTVADLRVDLARIEGKVDTFVSQMEVQDNRTTQLAGTVAQNAKDTDKRLGKVENRQYYMGGFGAAVGAIAVAFVEFISGHSHS